ncbi:increased DNA methylation 2 isoform X1 [Lycium ferocissimum]|uniref:increased DNA methylation 2 isoform X1 n=2 Tax=Lycium ferocissimum TaxID=112874 RepID=UPI0028165213|nr:increased DNA methylation 2 isoform X1 [Lycium ferocissimum]
MMRYFLCFITSETDQWLRDKFTEFLLFPSNMKNNFIGLVPTDDQFFLLYFIIGTYFGPDLRREYPKKSVLQRKGLGLPPYTSNQLAGSCLRTVEVERVYYHALRKADPSVVLAQPWLHQFFHGRLPTLYRGEAAAYPRFCDLFPPNLHPHLCCDVYNVVANIVFINDPDTSSIEPDSIKRFKELTGLEHLIMDKDCTKSQTDVHNEALNNAGKKEMSKPDDVLQYASLAASTLPFGDVPLDTEQFDNTSFTSLLKDACDEPFNGMPPDTNGQFDTRPFSSLLKDACGGSFSNMPPDRNGQFDTTLFSGLLKNDGVGLFTNASPDSSTKFGSTPFGSLFKDASPLAEGSIGPSSKHTNSEELELSIVFLPSCPSKEEISKIVAATKSGFAVSGSAAKGKIGPVLGLLDVGESKDSYLFRVSLPGVQRDEREFTCEVESDGKVLIRGMTTTGDRTVSKYSQVFEMQTQNLCPTGHFTISFKLPGPVDPQEFSGNFGTDGILEGIVLKAEGQSKWNRVH